MTILFRDLRFAARQLTANPGFAGIVVVTLALGVGAITTCFSVLNASRSISPTAAARCGRCCR